MKQNYAPYQSEWGTYTSEGVSLDFRLYRPNDVENAPLVVLIHGGGWVSGNPDNMAILAEVLAEKGMAAACIEYRLAPKFPFPAALDDVCAFADFARKEAATLKINPDRIGSWGISAGAHLSLVLATRKKVSAAVAMCPITDLVDYGSVYPPRSHEFVELFLGPYDEEKYRSASPLHAVTKETAPCFLTHGERDTVVPFDQSVRMEAALKENGVAVDWLPMKYEDHSYSFEVWPEVEQKCVQFLKRYLD